MTRYHNPSPNRYDGRDRPVDLVVLHYTASRGSASAVAAMFASSKRKASAHYVVGRDGVVWECVDEEDGAWHAGDGRFPNAEQLALSDLEEGTPIPASQVPKRPRDVNMRSIGIEIVNAGWLDGGPNPYIEARHRNPASRSKRWESYTPKQDIAVENLILGIAERHPTVRWVTGHEDVTNRYTLGKPGAKLDPGPAWDWEGLMGAIVHTKIQRIIFDFEAKGWRVCQ